MRTREPQAAGRQGRPRAPCSSWGPGGAGPATHRPVPLQPDSEVAEAGRCLEVFFEGWLKEIYPEKRFAQPRQEDSDSEEVSSESGYSTPQGFPWPHYVQEGIQPKRRRRHMVGAAAKSCCWRVGGRTERAGERPLPSQQRCRPTLPASPLAQGQARLCGAQLPQLPPGPGTQGVAGPAQGHPTKEQQKWGEKPGLRLQLELVSPHHDTPREWPGLGFLISAWVWGRERPAASWHREGRSAPTFCLSACAGPEPPASRPGSDRRPWGAHTRPPAPRGVSASCACILGVGESAGPGSQVTVAFPRWRT